MIRSLARRALIAAVAVYALGGIAAQEQPAGRVSVQKVLPESAVAGDHVTIVLSHPVKNPIVKFGGKQAKVDSVTEKVLYVTVPNGLKTGATPIFVDGERVDSGHRKFHVLHQGFKALGDAQPTTVPTSTTSSRAGTSTASQVPTSTGTSQGRWEWVDWQFAFSPLKHPYFTVGLVVILSLTIELYRGWRRRRALTASIGSLRFINEQAQAKAALSPDDALTGGDYPDGPPAVPDELVSICALGNCILFAGPGLGAQAGLPTRYEAVARILQSADLTPQWRAELTTAVNAGQLAFATEVLAGKVSHEDLVEELEGLYFHSPDLSPAHKALADISFAAAITTSWDTMLDTAFSDRKPIVIASEDDAGKLSPKRNDFFIAKLNGDLSNPQSIIFSSAEARQTVNDRPTLARFVAGEALSRSVFFVGMSLSGIEEFFENFGRFRLRSTLPAYAVLPHAPFWETQCERFEMRYGVKLIGYKPSAGHPEITAFLTELANRVKKVAPRRRREQTAPRLRKLRLTNIGVFTNLEIDFNDGWNLILGNNGSGKSTILRAIALALCGNDAAALDAGQRLLRQDKGMGKIELTVGEVTYETVLRRNTQTRKVLITGALTPLQKRDWVVLGFPPLRGISLNNPPGPSLGGSPDPQVEDLIPVITGGFDTRLDSLKQWLVNLEVNSSGSVPRDIAARNKRLRESFFDLLNKLIPGQSIGFGDVDRNTWQVFVTTDDGKVPIDDVSQGMGSIFGWAGTLLQRLYEIHTEMDNPALAPALVLIDEIDAHLHPEWQQKLVPIVREQFKNMQVVATTHSPLIVGGMKQQELLIADRDMEDRHKVTVTHSLINPEGLRADQVLTSPLFGLQGTRSPDVVKKISRYSFLFGKTEMSDDEKREMDELKASLSGMLMHGETVPEREAERAAVEATKATSDEIVAAAAASSPESKELMRKELEGE